MSKLTPNRMDEVLGYIRTRENRFTGLWKISRELHISQSYAGELCRCLLARGLFERRSMSGRKGRRVEYREKVK